MEKEILSQELSFDELENITGGMKNQSGKKEYCPKCKTMAYFTYFSGGRCVCQNCKETIMK